ncbi:MAG: Amidophosphoribosyltransferase [Candidatus Ozemobacter sibiricus]|jgi:amidophosphoribosyltransferase|uniref:Amidophosphoribosyltransferase n=1 Tax=Candidatus Ozemobacter sibiricus TaxID=2268124 RepID=A0A367ZIT9_9BACT|nr:MAG: Amidophosphoribosyltransferase [Candidatus Ozemobacter sibiricus]
MCGILGLIGPDDVARELAFGLTALQHRGQDAAGLVTFDRAFRIKKGNGLVGQLFHDGVLARLAAPAGLGHVRYATQGPVDPAQAQPIYMNYPFGVAMVHNGNVTNAPALARRLQRDHRVIETANDLELLLYTFADGLEQRQVAALTPDDVFAAVEGVQTSVEGAYAVLTLLANRGLVGFTDPCGIRPLVLGKRVTGKGPVYAFASETAGLDALGYQTIAELGPGEAVFIDAERRIHARTLVQRPPAFCLFEYIYFAREDSVLRGRLVAEERVAMGRRLARPLLAAGLRPDVIIDVPTSAYFFAEGLADELKVPYRRGFAKNKYVGRSFLFPTPELRQRAVRQKLAPLPNVIRGKKVAVVDDSIVRGTTSRHLVELVREGGAAAVYFVSAAPPVRHPCVYGIDMSIRTELIAANNDLPDIARYIGADAVIYQDLDDLRALYPAGQWCDACFSGCFPTAVDRACFDRIEQERVRAQQPVATEPPAARPGPASYSGAISAWPTNGGTSHEA